MNATKELESLIRAAWESAPTDAEILGAGIYPGDGNSETLRRKVTYAWYRAVAEVLQPKKIGEIGVRYGYSTLALKYKPDVIAFGWDNESYGQQSNSVAAKYFEFLWNENTNRLTELEEGEFDIFSVDGDHSTTGAIHDMELAFGATRPGGVILVDDVESISDVRRAFERFVAEYKLESFILPTYRGLGVIQRPEGWEKHPRSEDIGERISRSGWISVTAAEREEYRNGGYIRSGGTTESIQSDSDSGSGNRARDSAENIAGHGLVRESIRGVRAEHEEVETKAGTSNGLGEPTSQSGALSA